MLPAFILLLNGLFFQNLNDKNVVALVNSHPIHVKEFLFQAARERTLVYTYFADKYKLGEEPLKWENSYDGEIPKQLLKDRALKAAIRVKLQQIRMKDVGIQNEIDYLSFNNQYKKLISERKLKAKRGEVLYGPPLITEEEYFNYLFSNNVIRLQSKLSYENEHENKNYSLWVIGQSKNAIIEVFEDVLEKVEM